MVPFSKLPRDAQKTILALIVLAGSASLTSCCPAPICDPPPVPPASSPTTAPGLLTRSAPTVSPAITRMPPSPTAPMICDPTVPPPTLTATATITPTGTPEITPVICDPAPPPFTPKPETRRDVTSPALPLAEIRTVEIVWAGGLAFTAETPWPKANYRWSASGGKLVEQGVRVTWQPPVDPGRYLLQVVADWDAMGVAVDSIVLAVYEDGSVRLG